MAPVINQRQDKPYPLFACVGDQPVQVLEGAFVEFTTLGLVTRIFPFSKCPRADYGDIHILS